MIKCTTCGATSPDFPKDQKCYVCRKSSLIFVESEETTLDSVQSERGKNYGKFIDHAKTVDFIMDKLRMVNMSKGPTTSLDWPAGFETALFYMVSKLVRLATSPDHIDSALDLSSYADLWLRIQKDES